ncbi:MAG: leucine-rich repeat protein [Clostridia bacterium]|nr:leucine-rich repeat protein [Clostridia bacterium]
MKIKTKKMITLIAFLTFAIFSIVAIVAFTLNKHVMNKDKRYIYQSTELVQMKRGEKLAFSEANEHFEEVRNQYGDRFQVHSQGAYHLSEGVWNNYPEDVSSLIYIDKDGYINATRTGVYQLEYTFAIEDKTDEKEGKYDIERCTVNTFTALVCVYEADEDKFEPLPDDPKEINEGYYFRDTVNYIMTKDITWEADTFWTIGGFNGTLINPHGYTLTWDITADKNQGGYRQIEALFGNNYGYIDGLKVKIVSDAEKPIEMGQFYGLVERNHGVLQNCEIEGTVYIGNPEQSYDPSHFYALPQHGFSFNNEARITVYSNVDINAYETTGLRESDIAERCWQSKNNRVYLDAWYYQDDVKAQRRAVETIEASETNSNTCEHLVYGKAGKEEKTVTLQVPDLADKVGEKKYRTCHWTAKENSPLEINKDWWETIRWSSYYWPSDYDNLEVKYWLVNGQKVERLDDVVVTEDVRIEPFVQYKETQIHKLDGWLYSLGKICNTEDVLELNDTSDAEGMVSLYDLAYMLRDPRCVIPTSIYVGKNYRAKTVMMGEEQSSMPFLLNYLQEGGELIIDSENPYVSFIGGKAFCNAQGTELYFYFEGKGETEITLHPQIEKISNNNAFWNGENYVKLDLTNVKELNQQIGDTLPNLREINLGKELTKIMGGAAGDTVNHFLRRMPILTKVEVSESHLTLRAKDNFVYEEGAGATRLLYAPKTLKGEVRVPDDVTELDNDCFNGSGITHLIFPDSLKQMDLSALTGMNSLEKITFGASEELLFLSKTELPSLTSVVFNGTKNIEADVSNFMYANLDTIVLSKELQSFDKIFVDCKAYQISEENAAWETIDGVLYNKQENTLAMYPKKKEGDSYTVLDGTLSVGQNAFYETKLTSVLFPDSCTQISDYAFNGSNVGNVIFKAKERIEIRPNAFYGCENLSGVSVATDATLALAMRAFRGCVNLKEFPYENVVFIGSEAFRETGIEHFEIGENVEWFLDGAFQDSGLKSVVIKSQINNNAIPNSAFANTPLERVELSESILYINAWAFADCKNLKSMDLKNVRSIAAHAFEGSGLEAVESEAVEEIYESAFASCENLERVDLPNVLTVTIGAFSASGVKIVNLPNVNRVEENAFADCEELVYISLAEGVSLGAYSFMNCIRLEELSFAVTAVGNQTFSGCTALKKVTVQGNVRNATQTFVFENCTSLKEVTIIGEIIEIGTSFFSGCTSLKKVFITHLGTENGTISATAFDLTAEAEVYLNVPENFLWKGKIPANITVYVPTECVETFRSEWLAEESQIKGYDFSNQENE